MFFSWEREPMDVKLVCSWPGPTTVSSPSEHSNRRTEFWSKLPKPGPGVEGLPPKSATEEAAEDEAWIATVEARLAVELPQKLQEQFDKFIRERPEFRPSRPKPSFWSFSRPVPVDSSIVITVKSIRYGSLELLLSLIVGKDFPLSASDIVHLLGMFAPQAIAAVAGTPPPIVSAVEAGGALQAGGGGGGGDDRHSTLGRAYYLANFSLLIPAILFLAVCYWTFQAMVGQIAKVDADRSQLLQDALKFVGESRTNGAQAIVDLSGKIDADRSRVLQDALKLLEQSRQAEKDLREQVRELKAGSGSNPPPITKTGGDPPVSVPPLNPGGASPGQLVLKTANYRVYSTSPSTTWNLHLGELAKEIIATGSKVPGKAAQELFKAIGEGFDAGKKGFEMGSAGVDFWENLTGKKEKGACFRSDRPAEIVHLDNTCLITVVNQGNPPPQPTPEKNKIVLFDRRVTFAFEKSYLDSRAEMALSELVDILQNSQDDVLIEGHADGKGPPDLNRRLSSCRAIAVRDFLQGKGISPRRLHTHGYGTGYLWLPYAPLDDANRRVRVTKCGDAATGEQRCVLASAEPVRASECEQYSRP
jgi:outer membrane protein OmpA-like peptidoglycan-associated protein